MGFNFPNAPTTNQLYPSSPIAGQAQYKWDGEKWVSVGIAASKVPLYQDDVASVADYLSTTPATSKFVSPATVWAAANPVPFTALATFTPNFAAALDIALTLTQAGHTLANPTGAKAGQKGIIYLIQDGTGGRTITTWGTWYKFPGGQKPTLSNAPNMVDVISYAVKSATEIECFFSNAMA